MTALRFCASISPAFAGRRRDLPPHDRGRQPVLTTYRRLLDLLDQRERRRFWLLCGMIFVMGALELAGVASILPFLAVLSEPTVVDTNPLLGAVYQWFGFTSTNQYLFFLGICTFLFILFGAAFKSLTIYILNRFSRMRDYSISSRLLGVYLRQPYVWFLNRHSAELGKAVLSEVEKVIVGVLVPALRILAYGTVTVMLAVFLLVAEPIATLVGTLVIGGGYVTVFMFARRYLSVIGAERVQANGARFRVAQEGLGGIKDVKLLGLEDGYLRRFRRPAERYAATDAAAMTIAEVPRFLLEAIVFGAMMAFLLTMLTTRGGSLDQIIPTIGVFALAGARIFPSLQQIYRAASNLRFNRPALDALHEDISARTATTFKAASGTGTLALRDRLELVDVHYRYPDSPRPALDGLDLVITANTTVGLVGTSGAGKTTAADILLGLLTPHAGALVVDGQEIDATNLRAWQRRLGYVPQHIFLTDDSIAANIALGRSADEIDMAAVERAARIAELNHFVLSELPDGYATEVGERGVRLSGGQRQRIGIARALYHDPDVLILDEATSALDNLTERAVMDAVHNLAHAKTVIMIAHRLSTVRHCDTIFMLEHGRCVAAGDYDTLFDQHEAFRDLALAAM
jgi:ABC-type multidrug transport system fused ATPase/permease subunit